VESFPNPELINDRPSHAPSARLENIVPEYRKPLYGNLIALELGMETILEKCPRFNNWIHLIIDRMLE